MRDDIIDITTITGKKIKNELPIEKIIEYEENIEEIITNSKQGEKEEDKRK